MPESAELARLENRLEDLGPVALAVSGGVDSMTLAFVAHRLSGSEATVFHAVSPAVPAEASARVRDYARRCGWRLEVIDAGEFRDPDYLRNPSNRCFFCKTNLYGAIAARTEAQIASGTNLDDLDDWRPGLAAARNHAVRHPYVEAGIDKAGVRRLAGKLGLADLAELPAAPCLSSRLQTGIRVEPETLAFVHAVERLIDRALTPETARCRVRRDGVTIELDAASLLRIEQDGTAALRADLARLCARHDRRGELRFQPYRRGSAFERPEQHGL